MGDLSWSEAGWMADGNCLPYPPSTFFPSDGAGVDRARAICATCPSAAACLEYALVNRIDHGVWGGTSERGRRRILRRRRLSVAQPAASNPPHMSDERPGHSMR